jgi:hypothetical protein
MHSNNNAIMGYFHCSWNEEKDECNSRGCFWFGHKCKSKNDCTIISQKEECNQKKNCFWEKNLHFKDEGCLSFQMSDETPHDLLDSILEQRDFVKTIDIMRHPFKEEFQLLSRSGTYSANNLHDMFNVYTSNLYQEIAGIFDLHHKAHGNDQYIQLEPHVLAMIYTILSIPKTKKPTTLYRGLSVCDVYSAAHSFLSTSFDVNIAQRFARSCLVKIHLPAGFPFYSVNFSDPDIDLDARSVEREIILPPVILTSEGKLQRLKFASSLEQSIQVLSPENDIFSWDSKAESFSDFNRRYVEKLCQTEEAQVSLVKYICAKSKNFLNLKLDSEEISLIE